MSARICALVLLWLATSIARAAQPTAIAAQQAAATGDYHAAVANYEQLQRQEGYSAPALLNLGNAWLRLGKPAPAILAYERALILAPRDGAVQANLAAARQRAGIAPENVGQWLAAARYFSFDTYIWAGLVSVWVLCVALVLLCLRGRLRRLAAPLILLSVLTVCVSADAAVLCWPDLYRAVAQSSAILHLAPAASAAASGALHEGEDVWVQDHYGEFTQVRAADGRTGWVESAAAIPLRAPPR